MNTLNTLKTLTTLSAVVAILISANAQAQTATPRIDQHQANQAARINQGVASGQLTPKETATLNAQQQNIQAQKMAAKSDGVVTKQERQSIKRAQKRASNNIERKKHNARRV
ncbi:MAG: hypothetical protein RLZZ502_1643 [Pseudomonadota bacterium]|jgi:uncharacterized membrane protein YebE (DUF533 family)